MSILLYNGREWNRLWEDLLRCVEDGRASNETIASSLQLSLDDVAAYLEAAEDRVETRHRERLAEILERPDHARSNWGRRLRP